jgi:hypothetical protein
VVRRTETSLRQVRFQRYLQPLHQAEWVVYAKPPFGGPPQVLQYLGRYTHRTALSNERLLSMEDGKVIFAWKDYRHQNQSLEMTLEAEEFLRRFLVHILPPGFRRIRHFGFLSNRHRKEKLALCRKLLTDSVAALLPPPQQSSPLLPALAADSPARCPQCRIGEMIRVQTLPAYRWPTQPPDTS